jgi:hypothetical protein
MGRLSATMSSTGSDRRGKGAEHGRGRCAPTQRPIVGSAPALERTGAGRGWPVAGRGDRAPPEPGDSHHHSPGRGAAGGGARPVHPVVAAGPARPPGTLWDRVGQDGPAWIGRVLGGVHGYDPGRGLGGNFGFIAPVLAAESPASIDAINVYLPEVALNAVAFGGFVVGFVLFGLAMVKRATLPRSSGDAGRRGRPGPGVRIRSGPDRLTGVVDRCRPWERGPRRRPCLAWVSTVAETGALTPRSPAPAAADRHHATRSSGRAASP